MNLFSQIRYLKDSFRICSIHVSERVARGWVFVVKNPDGFKMLINETDLNVAIGSLPLYASDQINLSNSIFGIPLLENDDELLRAQTGIFEWVFRL